MKRGVYEERMIAASQADATWKQWRLESANERRTGELTMEGGQPVQSPGVATTATMTMEQAPLNRERIEAFFGRMVGMFNEASIALMCSIGHQTGLFDTMAALPPSTSTEIAEAAGLNERYVREWLGAMATGRIVDYDQERGVYALPPEHAIALTRGRGPNNMAAVAQFIPLIGNVEEQVIESFRHGGGVPYEAYPRFQQVMAEASAATFDATLIAATLPMIPGLVERLREGIDVLDVCCGHGHAVNVMARAFPASHFTGIDFSVEGITASQEEAVEWGLENARFEIQDVAALDTAAQFDFITAFDCIHDQAYPRQVLSAIARALRPGGVFLMVDVHASSHLSDNLEHPMAPMLYTMSCMHCMTVSLAQGGEGLGTVWGEQQATQLLREAGFTQVEIKLRPDDPRSSYYLATKEVYAD
jgi:SAM-dependent methyltransferase